MQLRAIEQDMYRERVPLMSAREKVSAVKVC
jgi:hypothetical protein